MMIEGSRKSSDLNPARIDLQIQAVGLDQDPIAELQAGVALRTSQHVVPGVAPMGETHSVFVVQLME